MRERGRRPLTFMSSIRFISQRASLSAPSCSSWCVHIVILVQIMCKEGSAHLHPFLRLLLEPMLELDVDRLELDNALSEYLTQANTRPEHAHAEVGGRPLNISRCRHLAGRGLWGRT